MTCQKPCLIANLKTAVMMRAADYPHQQRILRHRVITIDQAAIDFGLAIEMPDGAANILPCLWSRRYFGITTNRQNRINDFAIAGTTAQNPTKRIFDIMPVWCG